MLDKYIYGDIERISPESPVPVMKFRHTKETLGGAGNVAFNLAILGAQVHLFGVVGHDEDGEQIRRIAEKHCLATTGILTSDSRPTTVKTRLVARNQQVLRLDVETTSPVTQQEQELLIEKIHTTLHDIDVLILSDYAKGVLASDIPHRIIQNAREAGVITIVDPKGRDFSRYRGVRLVTPNRSELREATNMPCDEDDEIVTASNVLLNNHDIEAIITTRSERGMSVVTKDYHEHFPTTAQEVFDVSGAGDTVVAVLACALAHNFNLKEAAQLANTAAGIVVGKIGTSPVTPKELATALRHKEDRGTDNKVVLLNEAEVITEQWRKRGFTIGFTNGCFDLLHPGHLALIQQAKASCHRLIVGLNSDSSVRRLKGEGRPIQNELARAAILASLALIDLVVIFDEDTPINLIQTLRPNVLVKGADYSLEQVVGADFVQSYGGTILLANLVEGCSTSNTVQQITNH